MYNLILLGAPGVGKGTQAKKISNHFGIPHISTGEILRDHIKRGTEIGRASSKLLEQGEFVSDELIAGMVGDRLNQADVKEGFILDGFPRNLTQVSIFDQYLAGNGIEIDYIINIEVEEELLKKRLLGRRFCARLNKTFNIYFNPPKDGECSPDELERRVDDNEETVNNRMTQYYKLTKPLIDYYGKLDYFYAVDGNTTVEKSFERIREIMEKHSG